jgi:hypothetical protein
VVLVRTSSRSSDDLLAVLGALQPEIEHLDRVIVSDSSVESRILESELTGELPWLGDKLTVHQMGENGGPAASTNAGLALISTPPESTWVVVTDDDIPLSSGYLRAIRESIPRLTGLDADVAGFCTRGHRFDARRGRLVRPDRSEIRGLLPVDYLPTNFGPAFSLAALRAVGGWREELFIGHTEVWLGRDLRRAGYQLYALGWLWNPADRTANWRGVTFRVPRTAWRRYYSVRNLIVLVRTDAGWASAVWVSARSVAGWLLSHRTREGLVMTLRAVADGWAGRMGRTVEPGGRH